jgi:hypothetical protein
VPVWYHMATFGTNCSVLELWYIYNITVSLVGCALMSVVLPIILLEEKHVCI